jgi:hypothetical protein
MRNVRNITVSVNPKLYRQTRRLAVEYDTTVTDMVRFLLEKLPGALKQARYPVGGPQSGTAAAATPPTPVSTPPGTPPAASQVAPAPAPTSKTPSPVQIQQNLQNPPVPL